MEDGGLRPRKRYPSDLTDKGVRGYDAGKQVSGRKRHLLVDAHGLVLHAVVDAAA